MTQTRNSHPVDPAQTRFWARAWNWLCTYEEAMNRDPAYELRRRIKKLEAKVKSFEADGGEDEHAQI